MTRKLVSSSELREILNRELATHETCNDCRYGGVIPSEADTDGCNWSPPSLRCSGVPHEVCQPAAHEVLIAVRAKYNLQPPT